MSSEASIAKLSISGASTLPTEIWTAIGSKISSLSTLNELTLTCRAFRTIFSPLLFEKRVVQLQLWNPSTRSTRRNYLPPGLEHSKELGILLNEWHGTERDYDVDNNSKYGRFITRMISEMPKLQSFWWDDQAFEDYNPALILRFKRLIAALSSAPNLKRLSISFSSQFLDDVLDTKNCFIHLETFNNLTSLEMYHFHGKLKRLVKDIAQVLSRSPALKTLGLALACDGSTYNGPEAIVMDCHCAFWDLLCLKYASLGGQPLSLDTLRLGYGMLIADPLDNEQNHQALLFKQESLQTLHIFNGLVKFESSEEDEEDLNVEWKFLKGCTSLRQVAVSKLDKKTTFWLNETAKNLTELILTDHDYMDGRSQEFLPALNHKLSLLLAPENAYYGEDDDSSVSSSESGSSTTEDVGSESNESPIIGLSAIRKKIDDRHTTILDLLKDGGSHLTQLTMSLDYGIQWNNLISSLKNMKFLTHLYLIPKTWLREVEPPLHESDTPKDIAVRRAKLLKFNCPSIQFIRIQNWSWQFIAQRDFSKITKDDVHSPFELVEMDWNEVFNIDSFAIDFNTTQSGLPNKQRVPPFDYSDEIDDESARFESDDSDMSDLGQRRRTGWYRYDEVYELNTN